MSVRTVQEGTPNTKISPGIFKMKYTLKRSVLKKFIKVFLLKNYFHCYQIKVTSERISSHNLSSLYFYEIITVHLYVT